MNKGVNVCVSSFAYASLCALALRASRSAPHLDFVGLAGATVGESLNVHRSELVREFSVVELEESEDAGVGGGNGGGHGTGAEGAVGVG